MVEPHVKEAFSWYNAIAVLQVICRVEGVGNDEHIVALMLGAHGVIADDDAPMTAPVHVFDDNRRVVFQVAFDEFEEVSIVVRCFVLDGGMNLPAKLFKVFDHALGVGADSAAGGHNLAYSKLIVDDVALIIFYDHVGGSRSAGVVGYLLGGGELGQQREVLVGLHIVEVGVLKVRRFLDVVLADELRRAADVLLSHGVGDGAIEFSEQVVCAAEDDEAAAGCQQCFFFIHDGSSLSC